MAIKLTKVSDTRKDGIKLLGYGQSGEGKTRLIKTMDKPIVLNIEDKLGCLNGADIPVVSVYNASEAIEAIKWIIGSDEMREYSDIAVDSISELCDFIHADVYEKHNGNTFKIGPEVYLTITSIIKQFKALKDKNVYFIAKCAEAKDENGVARYMPSMSNNNLQNALPYKFDIVFAVRNIKFDGKEHNVLQCQKKGKWFSNDIYHTLDEYEQPNLSKLIKKIKGEK